MNRVCSVGAGMAVKSGTGERRYQESRGALGQPGVEREVVRRAEDQSPPVESVCPDMASFSSVWAQSA